MGYVCKKKEGREGRRNMNGKKGKIKSKWTQIPSKKKWTNEFCLVNAFSKIHQNKLRLFII